MCIIRYRLFNYDTNIIGVTCVGVDIVFLHTHHRVAKEPFRLLLDQSSAHRTRLGKPMFSFSKEQSSAHGSYLQFNSRWRYTLSMVPASPEGVSDVGTQNFGFLSQYKKVSGLSVHIRSNFCTSGLLWSTAPDMMRVPPASDGNLKPFPSLALHRSLQV